MGKPNWNNRTIWAADNLRIMRGMNSDSVDLIVTDPPYNSNADYAAPIGSDAAGAHFVDRWSLEQVDVDWVYMIAREHPCLASAIASVPTDSGQAFLIYNAVRVLEMHRILKPTGSIYWQCDQEMSHYLKAMLDAVFGWRNFRREIVWQRNNGAPKGNQFEPRNYGKDTDCILFYVKSAQAEFRVPRVHLSDDEMRKRFSKVDGRGRYNTATPLFRTPSMGARPNLCYAYMAPCGVVRNPHPSGWRVSRDRLADMDARGEIIWGDGSRPLRKTYADGYKGQPIGNLWTDIPNVGGAEDMDYPTQKPIALCERQICASSRRGDVVFDPFCGGATTLAAAEKLGRQWAGVDLSPRAVELMQARMNAEGTVRKRRHGKYVGGDLVLFDETKRAEEYVAEERSLFGLEIHTPTEPPQRSDVPACSHMRFDLGELTEPRADLPAMRCPVDVRDSVRVKEPHYAVHKSALYMEQDGRCAGCEIELPVAHFEVDHKLARSKGGSDRKSNLQLLCGPCNRLKAAGSLSRFLRLMEARKSDKAMRLPID